LSSRLGFIFPGELDDSVSVATPDAARFVAHGQTVAQFEAGDINGDGLLDYLLVVEEADARTLLLLVRQADGSVRLAGLNRRIIQCHLCEGEGGSFDVTPTGSGFEVSNTTGAGLVNAGEEFTFEYRSKEKTWVLIEQRSWNNDLTEDPPNHEELSFKPYEHGQVLRFGGVSGR